MKRILQSLRSGGIVRQALEQTLATLAVQVLGAITTLSFVHLLPKEEFALFGLCSTTVSFIAITSDLGLMSAMHYFWRSKVADGTPFGERYAAIRRVRLTLFLLTATISAGVLGWLMHQQREPISSILLLLALVLALAWTQITAAMLILPLRLAQQLRRAYSIEMTAALLRASMAVMAFALALKQAWFPLVTLGASQGVTYLLARRHIPDEIRTRAKPGPEAMRSVLGYVIPTMPGSLVFATQDMLVYGLASLAGGTAVVAEAFALGRLAAIFVTLNSVMSNVVIPRIVNLADDRHALRNGLVPVLITALFCIGLTGFAALFPDMVLFVLGKNYGGLRLELVLSLATASFGLLAQMLGQVSRTMGWIRWEAPMIALHAAMVLALVPFFSFGTTRAVLTFTLIVSGLGVLEMVAIQIIGWRSMRSRRVSA